jgi:hypothetical protein
LLDRPKSQIFWFKPMKTITENPIAQSLSYVSA